MGGGGGGWSPSYSTSGIDNLLSRANQQTDTKAYTSEVNGFLQEILKEYNVRQREEIRKHLEVLQQSINKEIEGAIDLLFGGSVKKHTYLKGLSDVDSLVLINNTSLENRSPHEVLNYIAEKVKERLPNTQVNPPGKLAVTVKYSDGIEIQLLPALKTKSGFKIISTTHENQWSNVIRPQAFASKLTEVNQACSGNVVPVIKLFKAIVAKKLPANLKVSGYHAESLAIEAFKDYNGSRTYKDMLAHFCRTASEQVKTPIKDKTGQSLHVDDYLGSTNSRERKQVSSWLSRIDVRLRNADSLQSLKKWQELFED
ncbi:tRNA nucleotidyltransferase (CCA-adding enzyme) [Leptolyngbya sp. PCC 7375]|nr:tRNA nucleotidyltransferase (CCA-adding enzyme) [Leptolyngbya sp. PCC 7375]